MYNAKTLITALSGHWHGHYGTAPSPVCQPDARKDQNALTIAEGFNGRLLAHCKRSNCAFTEIIVAAGCGFGDFRLLSPECVAKRTAENRAQVEKKSQQADRTWQEAGPIRGTIAETYFRGRGISCPLPDTLRFHPNAWHGATAQRLPAIVAIVAGVAGAAVHRTYLSPDGMAKASVSPNKAMLEAVSGGAVQLSYGHHALVVAEGIETALSLRLGLLTTQVAIWAALSAANLAKLRLPEPPGSLTIAADGDDAGRSSAQLLAVRAHELGWKVSLQPAPDGHDWNDVLTGKVVMA
ncbi:MAG: toprim domain-containing protein [Paracoccaceae bacterium]|nr:toprim domain-containing protein [Paracoccaceae bacterium]